MAYNPSHAKTIDYTLHTVKWSQVRTHIHDINPLIAQEIDELPDSKSLPFVRARLPFGAKVEDGVDLKLYYDNHPVSLNSPEIPKEIKALLDYNWQGIPVGMTTHNSLESYIELPTHVIPLRMYTPGVVFSLNSIFDPGKYTHVTHGAYSSTAGARSLTMLPKVSHNQYNERLAKAFGIKNHLCPKTIAQTWDLLQELTASKNFADPWYCELLFFSKDVVEQLESHFKSRYRLITKIWDYTAFSRNYAMYDLLWSQFTERLPSSIRNTPFIMETAKHIVLLAMKEAPGFVPAIDDMAGPVYQFTDIFLKIYRIRYYLPIFMQPQVFDGHEPVYYSLQRHTFFHPIPQRSNANRTIDELKTIKGLIESFKADMLAGKLPFNMKDTILYKTLQEVEFDFYHPQGDSELNTDIMSIAKEDKRFETIVSQLEPNPKLAFPDHSVFFNGCIRIKPKRKDFPKPSMKDFLMPLAGKKLSDDD